MQNTMERVAVQLHLGHRSEGGPTVSKVWRFSSTEQYTRKRVQEYSTVVQEYNNKIL